jgi:hypothetical protein
VQESEAWTEGASGALERDLPARVVVVGDLNGHVGVLFRLLRGLRLVRASGAWSGGRAVLVQLGDVVNRGPGARAAMDLLARLQGEARAAGGDVLWILGNHEVMTTLGHEAYVCAEEYLEFATFEEVARFHEARARVVFELLGSPDRPGIVAPIEGRIRAWEEAAAPGRAAFRSALGEAGPYGHRIRTLPVAVRLGPLCFVHGGLAPRWAALGLGGLEDEVRRVWRSRPRFYQDLDPRGLFRDPAGPLWYRAPCFSEARAMRAEVEEALRLVGARHLVVGHTRTDAVAPDRIGQPVARHGGRLVMADVALGAPGEAGAVVVVERGRVESWSPGGSRRRLVQLRGR